MLSTCPSCLNQVLHDDHIKEIRCTECGTVFPTVMHNGEQDDTAENFEIEKPKNEPINDLFTASKNDKNSEKKDAEDNFEESKLAFEEICNFGRNLESDEKPVEKKSEPLDEKKVAENFFEFQQEKNKTATQTEPNETRLITNGDFLQDFVIESYIDTVSSLSVLKETLEAPLSEAFDAIWNQAKAKGANGIISLRINLFGSPTKVLLTGTAIRYSKKVT